jgi:hypothetical protein
MADEDKHLFKILASDFTESILRNHLNLQFHEFCLTVYYRNQLVTWGKQIFFISGNIFQYSM